MREIEIKGLKETVYEEVLDNGLKVYVWQSLKAHSFQGVLNVLCGADDLEFTYKGKKYNIHRGAHHYLEHVMCETLDEPLLSKFNKLGSYSNAHTQYKTTSYLFEGTANLKENILLLLSSVFEKEFSKEQVEHERIPILEEMRMRRDNPGVISYFTLNDMLFNNYPNKVDTGGTEEDILNITLEELKLLYDVFYHPSNMSLVITGNVNPYEVLSIVKDYFKDKTYPLWKEPKRKNYREGRKVNIKEKTIKCNIEVPEVIVNVKIPYSLFKGFDKVKLFNILSVVMSANFGSTSLFKENLLEKKLINSMYFSAYKMYDYLIIELGVRSKYYNEVKDMIIDRLKNMELYFEDVKRKINSAVATLVLSYEDITEVNDIISNDLIYHGKVIDNEKELLESITLEDLETVFNLLSFKEMITLTMLPKEE